MCSISARLDQELIRTSVLQPLLPETGFSPEIEEKTITEIESQVDQKIKQTCWIVIEEAGKTSTYVKGQFLKIGQSCFKLAQYYFSKGIPEKATSYGEKALSYLSQCCTYPTYPSRDSRNWFLISNLYAFQAKLNTKNKELSLVQKELSAVNAASSEVHHPQAMLRKLELLQILEAGGLPTSESSLICLRSYLDRHPDPMSDDYLEKTHFYFAKRASEERRSRPLFDWKNQSGEPSSLLSEANDLVRGFSSKSLSTEGVIAKAELLILKCLHTKDLFLARKGLCSLLKLPIERIQKDVIDCLKPLFRLSYLIDDIQKGSKSIIFSEKAVRSCIESFDLSTSSEQFLLFLDLYIDIVERLWLLPYLASEKADTIQRCLSELIKPVQSWITSLLKDNKIHGGITDILMTLQLIFQMISSCSSITKRKIVELKPKLHLSTLPILIGKIYQDIDANHRAIKHYLYNLSSLIFEKTENEARTLNHLGIAYHSLGENLKAIEYHEKELKIVRELRDRGGEGNAYANLGIAYRNLGEYRKAIECHKKHLKIARELRDWNGEGNSYGNLGVAYRDLGEYAKAIEYQAKHLMIARELNDRVGEGRANANLGIAYYSFGEYSKAIEYLEKSLEIDLELEDRTGVGIAYASLGVAYRNLGECRRAIEYLEKSLKIARELGDRGSEGIAYGNLATAHDSLGEYPKAIEYYEKRLQIAQDLGSRAGEKSAYANLGITYFRQEAWPKAIECYEKALEISRDLGKSDDKGVYMSLGLACYIFKKYEKAINYYKKTLEIARDLGDQSCEGKVYVNLGLVYDSLDDLSRSKKYFFKSIRQFSILQQNLGDNHQWKIAIFEEQSKPYIGLEWVLLKRKEVEQALEIADARRSRALVSALSNRCSSLANRFSESTLMSVQEMQGLAQKLQTMFAVYSLDPLGAAFISVWIIPIKGQIIYRSLPIDTLSEELKSTSGLLKQFPYISTRPTRPVRVRGEDFDLDPIQELPTLPFLEEMEELYRGSGGGGSEEKFKERLSQWYTALIAPIQDCLPTDSTQTVTIIPDGFLSQLPFAAFRDQEGNYLIEKHPICIAPSLKALQLLDQLPKEFPSDSLAIGNPATPNLKDELKLSEKEVVEKVAPILGILPDRVWTKQACTVGRVLEEMPKARFIHFACHGLPGDKPGEKLDPHSVFEGLLKLAPDKIRENGYLYAQEIADLPLKAELVFMSACFSGRGKLQREGTIGHNWSFLAAGARSTISTYWRLAESELTLEMVETFYRHLLGKEAKKLNKAQALQRAMRMAIGKERENPHKWGAFFLSGLDGEYDPTLTSQLITEKINLNEGVSFPNTDHSIESSSITAFSSGSSFLNPPTEIHSFKQSLSHTQSNTKLNHFWRVSPKNTDQISIREMRSASGKVRGFSKMVQETWLEKQLQDLCAEKVDWVGSITDANCDLLDLSSLLNEAKKNIPICLLINSHLHYSLIIYDPGQQTIYRFNSLSVQENELEKKVIEKIQELLQVKQVVLNKRASQNGIEDGWSCAFHGLYFLERFLQGDSMDVIDRHPLTEAALASKLTHYYFFLSQELTKIPETHLAFFEVSLAEKTISELATILKAICTQGLQAQKDDKPVLDSWLQIECILIKLWLLQQKAPLTFKQFIEQMTHFEHDERKFLKETLDRTHYQREPIVDLFLETYKIHNGKSF